MARIRTIKPEFFTSEDIVSLSPHARLLYIALWCESDREGRLAWKPLTFKIRYFPVDDVSIEDLCQELIERKLVETYGNGLAFIPTFLRHQHINPRESASVLAPPSTSPRVTNASSRVTNASSRVTNASSRDSDVQVGREGKEGKDMSGSPDDAAEVLAHLNSKAGRNYQGVAANLDLIRHRIRDGATVDDCKAVIDAKCVEWGSDPKMASYLRPATLFNASKFAQYIGQLGTGNQEFNPWEPVV